MLTATEYTYLIENNPDEFKVKYEDLKKSLCKSNKIFDSGEDAVKAGLKTGDYFCYSENNKVHSKPFEVAVVSDYFLFSEFGAVFLIEHMVAEKDDNVKQRN